MWKVVTVRVVFSIRCSLVAQFVCQQCQLCWRIINGEAAKQQPQIIVPLLYLSRPILRVTRYNDQTVVTPESCNNRITTLSTTNPEI